jgi:hypothetical protein
VIVHCYVSKPTLEAKCRRYPASHVAYVTLEPIGADPAGYAFLEKVVCGLARATGSVWIDPNKQAYAHDECQFELGTQRCQGRGWLSLHQE